MVEVLVHAPGPVTVYDAKTYGSSDPPFMVGDPNGAFDDESDSSYAELETFENPEVSYADSARATLAPTSVPAGTTDTKVALRIRYQSLAADMRPPARAYIRRTDTNGILLRADDTDAPAVGATSPTWLDLPLTPDDTDDLAFFLNNLNSGTTPLQFVVYAPYLRTYRRLVRTRIFEARVIVTGRGRYAPPCRIFPRSDGLGVGGGRQYPAPRSQQVGGRWVGYY